MGNDGSEKKSIKPMGTVYLFQGNVAVGGLTTAV